MDRRQGHTEVRLVCCHQKATDSLALIWLNEVAYTVVLSACIWYWFNRRSIATAEHMFPTDRPVFPCPPLPGSIDTYFNRLIQSLRVKTSGQPYN